MNRTFLLIILIIFPFIVKGQQLPVFSPPVNHISTDTNSSVYYNNKTFSPSDIPGLSLWLSAGSNVTLNGSNVFQWTDLSPNAFIASQVNPASQPLFVNSINEMHHEPAIKFDGINDFLVINNNITVGTLFIVLNWDGTENVFPGANGAFTSSAAPYDMIFGLITTTNLRYQVFNEGDIFINGRVTPDFGPFQKFKIVSAKDPLTNSYPNIYIGNTEGNITMSWKGKIAEIITYDNVLTSADRLLVEKYLHLKYAPPVNLGPDIYIPYGFCDTTLDAGDHYIDYKWSTGATTSSITVKNGDRYSVTVTDIFDSITMDTINVNKPSLNLNDTTICQFTSAIINSHLSDDYDFYWSTNETTSYITVSDSGLYWLKVTDSLGCSIIDSFYVSLDFYPSRATLGPDTSLCAGDSIGLVWGAPQTVSYLWSDFSTGSHLVIYNPGTYHVTVTDNNGCVARDTIEVTTKGPLPLTAFVSDSVCFGGVTHFTDRSSVPPPYSISEWDWDFGDFTIPSTLQNPSHTYSSAGIYNVTLRTVTDVGCSKSLTQQVYVYSIPLADLYPTNGCSSVPIQFHDNTHNQLGDITAWHWNFGDPGSGINNESELKNPIHTYANAGNYTITLIATSDAGCYGTVLKTIIVRQSADVDFSYTEACVGETVYFTDLTQTPVYNSILGWKWHFGDGDSAEISNPSHKYESAGTFQVTLKINTLNGCAISITKPVIIYAKPYPDFILSDICAAIPFQFIDNSNVQNGFITHWEWQIINLDTQYVQNPVFTFPTPGNYTVKLITTTQAGCKDSISREVSVYASPLADFNFSPKYGVAPLTVNFTNNSNGGATYLWTFGDASGTSILKNPTYTFTQNGIYNVKLITYNQNDCYDSIVKQIKIIPSSLDIAVKEIQSNIANNYLIVSADLINLGTRTIEELYLFIESNQGNNIRERWTGILESGNQLNYKFTAEIPLSEQTIDYICVRASVPDSPKDDNPANDEKCKALVDDFILLDPYPNPTNGILNIAFILPIADNVNVNLYSSTGAKIKELFSGDGLKGYNILTFDFSKLAKGMYAIQIRYRDKVKVVKFVKD